MSAITPTTPTVPAVPELRATVAGRDAVPLLAGAIAVAGGVLAVAWGTAAGPHGTHPQPIAGAVGMAVAAAVTAWVALRCGRGRDARFRRAWLLIAAGWTVWSVGRIGAALAGDAAISDPVAAIRHGGFLVSVPLVAAGVIHLWPVRGRRRPRWRDGVDLTLVAVALGAIATAWLSGAEAGPAVQPVARIAALLAAGDVLLLLAVLAVGLRFGNAGLPPALVAMAGAIACFAVADAVALRRWIGGQPEAGWGSDGAMLVAFALAAVAGGLERRAAPSPHAGPDAGDDPAWWLGLGAALAAVAVAAGLGRLAAGGAPGAGWAAVAGGLAALALAGGRMAWALAAARREVRLLRDRVDRDPLTGLINHRALHERIGGELDRARLGAYPLALALIDVDDFKTVNDTFGHLAGDQALRDLATTLSAACRDTDIAGRYAGDEFVLILPGLDLATARAVCRRVLADLGRRAAEIAGDGPALRLSIGLVACRAGWGSADHLLALADAAMYDAKHAGKNRVVAVDADTLVSWADDDGTAPEWAVVSGPALVGGGAAAWAEGAG